MVGVRVEAIDTELDVDEDSAAITVSERRIYLAMLGAANDDSSTAHCGTGTPTY